MSLAIAPQVVFEVVGGEAVLLNLESGTYYQLTDVGSRIWQMLEQGETDEDRLQERLLGEYDVTPDKLQADLNALVGDLVAAGLLTRSGAGQS